MQGSQMSWLVAMRHLGSLAQWLSMSTKLYVSAPYHSALIATDLVLEDFASRLLPGFGAFPSLTRLDMNGLKCTDRGMSWKAGGGGRSSSPSNTWNKQSEQAPFF